MRFTKKALIVTICTIVLLLIVEITLRTFFPQDAIVTYEQGSMGLSDAALGHNNRPGSITKVHTPEFDVVYKISDEGFRDDKNHLGTDTNSSTTVMLLGDSFTFGIGNQYKDIWPVIFESNLLQEGYETHIIKAGVPAYDTTKELLLLERLFPKYQPDIVVFVFLANDVFTNTPILDNTSPENDKTTTYKKDKKSSFNILTLYKRFLLSNDWIYSKLYLLTRRSEYFSYPPSDRLESQLKITSELLLRASEFCRQRGAEFVVLSIPQQFQVIYKANGFEFNSIDEELIDKHLQSFADTNGIVWISVLNKLVEHRKNDNSNLYYRLDGHLDKQGNLVVGNYFTKAFLEIFNGKLNKAE